MKTRLLLAGMMAFGIVTLSFGQEDQQKTTKEMQTLFGNSHHKISHGGYAAVSIGYTQIDNQDVMTLGGRAGWLIDHHVTVGLAGKAFMNSVYIKGYWPIDQGFEDGYYLVGGYGGLFVEPIIAPNFPIHVSFPVLIGAGGLALNEYTWHDYNWNNTYNEPFDWDSYFVVEPGVEIDINVVKFFRIAFGASYRFTSNMHMAFVPKDLMNGINGSVTFKFGKF